MARVFPLAIAFSESEASAGLRGQPIVSALSKIRGFFTSQEGTRDSWPEDPWINADPGINDADNVTKPDPDYCPKPEEYDWFPCKTHWDDSKNKWQKCKPPHSGQKCESPIEGCKSFQVQFCKPRNGANCECPLYPPGQDTRPTGQPSTTTTSTLYCPKPEEYDWFPCHTHWDDSKNKWQDCKPPHSGQKCKSPIEGCKSFQVQFCKPRNGANCECPLYPPGQDPRTTRQTTDKTTTTQNPNCPEPTDYDWFPCKTHKDEKGKKWQKCVTPHSGVTCKSPIPGCPKMQAQFCPPSPNGAMCECPMFPPGEDHRPTYTTTTKEPSTPRRRRRMTTVTTTEEPTTTESTTEPSTGPTTPTTTTLHPTSPPAVEDPSTPVGVYFLFPIAALMVCVCAVGVNIYRSRRARAQAPGTESMLGQSMQATGARTVD